MQDQKTLEKMLEHDDHDAYQYLTWTTMPIMGPGDIRRGVVFDIESALLCGQDLENWRIY